MAREETKFDTSPSELDRSERISIQTFFFLFFCGTGVGKKVDNAAVEDELRR